MAQYLHVQCLEYALLLHSSCVEQVIAIDHNLGECTEVNWRDEVLPVLDVTTLFNGKTSCDNRHYLVIRDTDTNIVIAASVGQVLNVEALAESEFSSIPQLSFDVQKYFDKAYIHPDTKQCIYRLKVAALVGAINDD